MFLLKYKFNYIHPVYTSLLYFTIIFILFYTRHLSCDTLFDNIDFKKVSILFTIGNGRSGTTFVGQLLNLHPNCLITNEWAVLRKWGEGDRTESSLFSLLRQSILTSNPQFTKNNRRTNNIWQSDWKEVNGSTSWTGLYKKDKILLIGDKKSGGNLKVIKSFPNEMYSLVKKNKNIKFLLIMRNPDEVVESIKRVSKKKKNISGIYDCKEVVNSFIQAHSWAKRIGGTTTSRYFYLHYEELIKNTTNTILKLERWLELPEQRIFPRLNGLTIKKWRELTINMVSSKPVKMKIKTCIKETYKLHTHPLFSYYFK